jgi:microcystin-dependent protein
MTTPYLGEIQLFGFTFAPYTWATCSGQLMPISQNSTLFSLLGTNYGGDGRSNFGLPNFLDNASCSQGQGPGLTPRTVGESFGEAGVSVLASQMPSHNHALNLYRQTVPAQRHSVPLANDGVLLPGSASPFVPNVAPNTTFAPTMIGVTGGGQAHENRQPFLALNFCIALQGVFPQRP